MSKAVPASLKLRIITTDSLLADEEVQEVSLPSLEGYLGVLPGHRPMVVALGKGKIFYRVSHEEKNISIKGGYAEIFPEQVLAFVKRGPDDTEQSV